MFVELEGLPDKGDVSDWIDVDGNDAEKLLVLAMRAEATARGTLRANARHGRSSCRSE